MRVPNHAYFARLLHHDLLLHCIHRPCALERLLAYLHALDKSAMGDPFSVEARKRLSMAAKGKVSDDDRPKYEAMMKQLKEDGWVPSKNTPKPSSAGHPSKQAMDSEGKRGRLVGRCARGHWHTRALYMSQNMPCTAGP